MARARLGSRDAPLGPEDGLTLVEVMVAIVVLLVGVLGTVTMIDGANALTSRTKAREGGTALARSVLEIARGIPYRDLSSARVLIEVEGHPGLGDAKPGVAGHQIASRGFVYTLSPVVCSMDDPKDNLGEHDEVAVDFCSDSDVHAGGGDPVDRNPDDYRRASVQLSWNSDATHVDTLKQTGIVTNPVGGLGPSVIELAPDVPSTTTIVSGTTASYDVRTSGVAEQVTWSVNGVPLGDAEGSDTDWEFGWDLGDVDAPAFYDCNYVLQAEAFDDKGRAGATKALTVTLNRRAPFAPSSFVGGRNLNGDRVDVQWDGLPECDVQRYEVYRGTAPEAVDTLVCTRELGERTECVDESAPAGQLYYEVVAVDKDALGVDREGDRVQIAIVEGNGEPPTTPSNVLVCTGGNPDCNDIDGEPAPDGTAVLSWDPSDDPDGVAFYRVYRRPAGAGGSATYADRLDVLFPVAGKPLVFLDSPPAGAYAYQVSAVDSLFGESVLSAEVAWQ